MIVGYGEKLHVPERNELRELMLGMAAMRKMRKSWEQDEGRGWPAGGK